MLFKFTVITSLLLASQLCSAADASSSSTKKTPTLYEQAIAAFAKNDMATAMMILLPLAESGDQQSQFMVASNYHKNGDVDNAVFWYKKAAELGHMEAQTTLGLLYINGVDVDVDAKLAAKYLLMATRNKQAKLEEEKLKKSRDENAKKDSKMKKDKNTDYDKGLEAYNNKDFLSALMLWLPLSEGGDLEAEFMVGKMYLDEEVGHLDPLKSVYWFTRAANKNHLPSQTQLGLMYLNGDLIDRDLVQATDWLLKASQNEKGLALSDKEKKSQAKKLKKKSPKKLRLENMETFRKGMMAYDQANYEKAIMYLYPLAIQNFDEAQFMLGKIYVRDKNVYKDLKKGLQWYERAIEQGNVQAARSLGLMYLNGTDVEQNSAKGVELLLEAGRLGDPVSQVALGNIYLKGKHAEFNEPKAAYWFQKAGKQKDPDAQYALGEMYYSGEGIDQNISKALRLFKAADKQGHQKASLALAKHFYLDEKKPDYQQAFNFFEKSAKQGEMEACYYLGEMYYLGQATKQDYKQAYNWYLKAASVGHTGAAYQLGKIYVNGYGVKVDYKKGFEYFLSAAENGHAEAQNEVGVAYYSNQGVKRDVITSYAWFYLASLKSVKNSDKNRNLIYKKLTVEDKKKANELVVKFKKLYQ